MTVDVSWSTFAGSTHSLALELLLHGPLSRVELARRLELSTASLTRLSRPLIDRGVLVETSAQADSMTNRPTIPLDVVPTSRHFIGLKVSEHDVHAVLTTLRAEIVATAQTTLASQDPEEVVATVTRLVSDLRGEAPLLTGVGVSVGGLVARHNVVTRAPFLGWTTPTPLAAMVAQRTALPTVVDNDILALTRAEHWFGAGRGHDHFAVLTTGSGVGCGLVAHGDVVESPDAGVGLINHTPLDPLGPLCPRGHRGCADAMLSIPNIEFRISMGLRRQVSYEQCLDLAEADDPVAAAAVTESGAALGRLIANVANFTMARRIILTGEGMRLARTASQAMNEGIAAYRDPHADPLDIQIQPLNRTEWARGAATTAIQNYVLDTPEPTKRVN